jgi:hypothetical protein
VGSGIREARQVGDGRYFQEPQAGSEEGIASNILADRPDGSLGAAA